MVPRRVFIVLVYTLAVLIVTFSVLMAGFILLSKTDDSAAANVLRWIGGGSLLLIVIDLILLVGALGINALASDDRPR